MTTPLPNKAHRLALGLMAARGCNYGEAVETLKNLTLRLVCDDNIRDSIAHQAALITALNCGQRAFLGGLRVEIPAEVRLLLPWPNQNTLNGVVDELLQESGKLIGDFSHTIYFGFQPDAPSPHALTVRASGWRGGVEPSSGRSSFQNDHGVDFALGGIFAAGLAVHRGLLRATGISIFACDESTGTSLWNPESDWLDGSNDGPPLRALPRGLWMLGLGHLGQAFLWTLGLLPFADPSGCELMLQDFDSIEEANVGAALLCAKMDIGRFKTRVCSEWAEARGFKTKICERPFDETTCRLDNEPAIALCGFDKAEPRRILEGANFLRVLECGLGGSLNDFDLIHVHNFPGSRSAKEIWKHASRASAPNEKLVLALSSPEETCGALAIETAGKSVSTSFVGAMASAVVFGELLRAFNRGARYDEVFLSPRNMVDCDFIRAAKSYSVSEIGAAGFSKVSSPKSAPLRELELPQRKAALPSGSPPTRASA